MACVAASHDAEACARLLGAARQIRDDTGVHLTMVEGHDPHQAQAHARSVLGTKQFAVATNTYRGGTEKLTRNSYDIAELYRGVLAEGLKRCM